MNRGYVNLWRKTVDDDLDPILWTFWTRILTVANWKERKEKMNNKSIICQPGQFTMGQEQLVNLTKLSKTQVRRAIKYFSKTDVRISVETSNRTSLYTILNWGLYQNNSADTDVELASNWRRTDGTQIIKELKKERKRTISDEIIQPKIIPTEKNEIKQEEILDPIFSVDVLKKAVQKVKVVKIKTPNDVLQNWITKTWREAYPKPCTYKRLLGAVVNSIPCNLTKEEAIELTKKIDSHSKTYIQNEELKYLISPVTYIESKAWTKPVISKKSITKDISDDTRINISEWNENDMEKLRKENKIRTYVRN